MTTISVLIPTAGRASLARTLDSLREQWHAGDEFVACCDRREWQPDEAWRAMVTERLPGGVRFTEVRYAADHACWGHCVLSLGLSQAHGDYLTVNDDDDIYCPGALDAIRARADESPNRPLIFRFRTWYGYVVPPVPGSVTKTAVGEIVAPPTGAIQEGNIGGHCLVLPNVRGRVGRYSCRYSGDWEYVVSSIEAWQAAGIEPVFCPEMIAWARPTDGDLRRMFGTVRKKVTA